VPITEYATQDDLALYGLTESALKGVDPEVVVTALQAASREADGYLGTQYRLPLEAIGPDLKKFVSWIAANTIMTSIGTSPESAMQFSKNYADAVKWLMGVRDGKIMPAGMIGAVTADPDTGQSPGSRPMVSSSAQRGFSDRSCGSGCGPDIIYDLGCGRGSGFGGD
jgi:phage gp36-like protein